MEIEYVFKRPVKCRKGHSNVPGARLVALVSTAAACASLQRAAFYGTDGKRLTGKHVAMSNDTLIVSMKDAGATLVEKRMHTKRFEKAPFDGRGGVSAADAATLSGRFTENLIATQAFRVMDRTEMDIIPEDIVHAAGSGGVYRPPDGSLS
jgi:hypothetical protein